MLPNPKPAATPEAVEIPIDGTLDLHHFDPRQIKELIQDYLAACQAKGLLEVRLIHGKGTGALRRTVHALLARHPEVLSFSLAHELFGGWGATVVRLRPPATPGSQRALAKPPRPGHS